MEAKKYPADLLSPASFKIVTEEQHSPLTEPAYDHIQFLSACLAQKDNELLQLRLQLQNIDNHPGWKILKKLDPAFKTFFPPLSFQSKLLARTFTLLKNSWNFITSRKSQLGNVELIPSALKPMGIGNFVSQMEIVLPNKQKKS
jgi:hypothetical protein